MFNDQQREALQQLFAEQNDSADPAETLQELRQQFVSVSQDESGAETESFDELAYVAEMRRRLIERQPLTDAEFRALADERAGNAQRAVVAVDPGLQPRVRLTASAEIEAAADEPLEMMVTLTVNAE